MTTGISYRKLLRWKIESQTIWIICVNFMASLRIFIAQKCVRGGIRLVYIMLPILVVGRISNLIENGGDVNSVDKYAENGEENDDKNDQESVVLVESVKAENLLLRDSNNELEEKNDLLKKLLDKEEEIPGKNNKSIAEVIATKRMMIQSEILPKLVIEKENKGDKVIVRDNVLKYFIKGGSIETNRIHCTNDEVYDLLHE
ncbi:hypothetical protein WA026_012326 [Henosepilachna vigintioctopunctata]|uniref:Uncharacterized protein n=1 Tax=Henosepilachna vigintioctopunctata TaxID=420089 RepID=A0AAW1UYJ3_9CUCU